ncbi:hypothetical protein D3C72_1960490 [compost metagenome]
MTTLTGKSVKPASSAWKSTSFHAMNSATGAPTSSFHFHNSKGVAMPMPQMRSRSAGVQRPRIDSIPSRRKRKIGSGMGYL